MKDEGLYKPRIMKAKCISIKGNRIELLLPDGIFSFETEYLDFFKVGEIYEMKDNIEHEVTSAHPL